MTRLYSMLFLCPALIALMTGCRKPDTDLIKSFHAATAGVRYRDEVFAKADTPFVNDIYRVCKTFSNKDTSLKLDVYQPSGDTASLRPAVLFFHGGGYLTGSEKDSYSVYTCSSLAKRGYVVISAGYRLGYAYTHTPPLSPMDSLIDFYETVYRATQDARSALRYIRKYGSLGRIDTQRIFVAGISAGSVLGINIAYLDQHEIPNINTAKLGVLDGTGPYDYPGYSIKVKGVVNMEGLIFDTAYIGPGNAPLMSFYGVNDPYYYGSVGTTSPSYSFFNGKLINARLLHLGIPAPPITTFSGGPFNGGHGTVSDPSNLPVVVNTFSDWLYQQLP